MISRAAGEALAYAISDGRVDEALALIRDRDKHQIDVNESASYWINWYEDTDTPLCRAIKRNKPEIVLALLDAGADVNKANEDGRTPLYCAAAWGRLAIVEILLGVKEIDTRNLSSEFGAAARKGNADVIRIFLRLALVGEGNDNDHYDRFIRDLNNTGICTIVNDTGVFTIDDDNYSYFLSERTILRKQLVEILKEKTENLLKENNIDKIQLEIAGLKNIKKNADIVNNTNTIIPKKTSMKEIEKLIKALKDKLTQLIKENNGSTLRQAIIDGNTTAALSLIEKRPELCQLKNADGYTPLFFAARGGCLPVVEALLNHGVDVDEAPEGAATPLYMAAGNGYLEVVQALLNKGADITRSRSLGETPLFAAGLGRHREILVTLFNHAIAKSHPGSCDFLITAVNQNETNLVGIQDFKRNRNYIRSVLVELLTERVNAMLESGDKEAIQLEILGLENIKKSLRIIQRCPGGDDDKTAKKKIKTLWIQLKAKCIELEKNELSSPANAVLHLAGLNRADLSHVESVRYLLNKTMTLEERADLLKTLKELTQVQFDDLKKQLKQFVPAVKRGQPPQADQIKLKQLLSDEPATYDSNAFLFILRTGTSEYQQKDTSSFNDIKTQILGYAVFNKLKSLGVFGSSEPKAPQVTKNATFTAFGNNTL